MLQSNLLRKIDMQDLLVFVHLYERNSVTQVSEELYVSQSTVSYCLKKLRNCLNDELFISSRQGLPPTAKATAIYPQIINILRSVNHCYQGEDAAPVYSKKVFSISAPEYFEIIFLPLLLRSFDISALTVSMEMHKFDQEIPIEALKRGAIDLVFCFAPPCYRNHPGIRMQSVIVDDLVCVMDAATAPLSNRIDLSEFLERRHVFPTPWTADMIDAWLSKLGYRREIVVKANSYGAAVRLLKGTPFLLVLPRRIAAQLAELDWLHYCEGPAGLPDLTLNMAWSNRSDRNTESALLRDEVLRASRDLRQDR